MKNFLLLFLCLFYGALAWGQTPISLPATPPYTEDFNTTPGAAIINNPYSYPTGWTSYNNGTIDNDMIGGSSLQNTGANYNYGSKIGLLGSGSAFVPSWIILAINTTSGLSGLKISYDVVKIRNQARSNSFNLQYSTTFPYNDATFTNVPAGAYNSAAIAEGTTNNYVNLDISALDNQAGTVYLRWYYDEISGAGSRDGIALDNVSITWNTTPPDINLTFDDTGALNIGAGSDKNVIFRTKAHVTTAAATLNQVVLRTNGTYASTDIKANGFKLWYSADATFDVGDTYLSQVNSVGGTGETLTFPTLSQSIAMDVAGYFFVTADISGSAILNRTIGITTTNLADFTFAALSNKTGVSNSGNLHTIIGLSMGTVATSFCVTPTQGEPLIIPFTYSPTGLYTGNFTAQLSNAAGSFAAPTSIGLVASNNTGSQSISAIIPANTPQGSNYRIRIASSVPNVQSADNGANITIDLLTISIAPAATQNLAQFQNGTTLTVTESSAIDSRRWKYRTAPSLVYSSFLSSNTTETPYFETAGTYFMVVETKFACGKTVISNEVQINVTTFVGTRLFPGDMAIVGWDSNIDAMGVDNFVLTNLVPLTQGTKFQVINATYENGSAANTRTNKWQSTNIMEFTYKLASDLAVGSTISFDLPSTGLGNANNVRINGIAVPTTTLQGVRITGLESNGVNVSAADPDQIFITQGKFQGNDFDGYVLFGMTNGSNWINLSSSVLTDRTSRLHTNILCLNTRHSTIIGGSFYKLASLHTGSQGEILSNIINMSNWTDLTTAGTNDLPAAVYTTTFNVTSTTIKSQWIGTVGSTNTNWFDCQNWSSLYVPDEYTDVAFTSTAVGNARIDASATYSNDFLDIAKARNLLIENRKLLMYDSRLVRLDIYKNLTIQNTGILDMENIANVTLDGTIHIKENWTNNIGTAAFIEGRSLVIFEGGNGQSITTLGTESFYDVNVNTGQDLTINQETILKNGLLFQSGNIISTTANPFTFDFDGSHTGATVNRHIRGASRRLSNKVENFVFPIGKSGIYRPITVHTQSGGAVTQFFAEYFYAGYGTYQPVITPLHHVSQIEYWILNRESGTSNAQLTLSWGIESDVQTLGSLVVAHWTSANQWESRGNSLTTGNPTAGTVKSAITINQFSPFTLGTILDNNILPVTWLSFDAKYNQEQENVLLEWKTVTEHQNQSFSVERSENGIDFKEIGIKNGGLTKNTIQSYQFWDFEPLQSKTYYRIKQIDTNGEFSYSTVKMIETEKDTKLGITNYENKTILYSNLDKATKAKVKIYDMNGKTVSFFDVFLKAGQNELLLPLNLSNAIYVYKIELEKQYNKINFVNGKFMVK